MNPGIQEFRDQLIPRVPAFYYDTGKKEYLVKQNEGENVREWITLSETQMTRVLALAGIRSVKGKEETMSPVANMLCDASMSSEKSVHYSGPLAGYKEGLVCIGGTRMLITTSPRILVPKEGEFPLIRTVVEGLLGETGGIQLPFFYAWLKLSYLALREGDTRGMPAVAMVGPKNCGKTFVQQHLITPILGGRMARPHNFMTGLTNFNADLFAAEHLAMGDESPSTDLRARRRFGAYIKNFVAEESQQLHAKFCDARTTRPFWRVTISLNDEAENVLTLPPIDDSISDKLMILGAKIFDFPMRVVLPEEKKAFAAAFAAEIPAFLDWLVKMPVDESILDQRFTVFAYHCPRILAMLTEVSPEYRLAELIKMCYFTEGSDDIRFTTRAVKMDIEMTALELERGLTSDDSPVYHEARDLLKGGGRKLVTYLGRLSQKFPEHVTQLRSSSSRKWRIRGIDKILGSIGSQGLD